MAEPEVLLSAETIAARVDSLAQEIAADLPPDFVMVVVLRGGFVFAADLARALARRGVGLEIEFIAASSYGECTSSRGRLDVRLDLGGPIAGRDVLLVDDILDTGITLDALRRTMLERGARRVASCCLLDKPARRTVPVTADFTGFAVADRFVVGYGLDYARRYRELPYVGVLDGL